MIQVPDVREVLAFESTAQHEPQWWREKAVRARWGISLVRYHQVLGRILEDPRALLIDPPLVARLLRLREAKRAKRQVRRVA